MLTLLNISNIALVDDLRVEFDAGLNLLTGETGSGKSIIVDALGILIGGRFTSDLLRSGADRGFIEGLFSVTSNPEFESILANGGLLSAEPEKPSRNSKTQTFDLIVRRELSTSGKNKIFINNQLATLSLLREIRHFLVDIHGQGEQQTLFNVDTHLELLDAFAGVTDHRVRVAAAYQEWSSLKRKLDELKQNEAERFQLVDILKFQIKELEQAQLTVGEDESLENERRRLLNVEKLTTLCAESYSLVYEDDDAALARVRQATKHLEEIAEYESTFREYLDGLESARAVLEELAFSLREFSDKLEFSPSRLAEIEDRAAELSRLKRKYGGSITAALEHLATSQDRLGQIEHADERDAQLRNELASARSAYLDTANKLHAERIRAAKKFEQAVERGLAEVAMESARFQVQLTAPAAGELADERVADSAFTAKGMDQVEFYFSANVGEEVKPLARVASGGEASRLMLVLKTVAKASEFPRTIVFDEIDAGIGGRISEAVGAKLKKLSDTNQVLCVTHQAQIARFADNHLVVQKGTSHGRTQVCVVDLDQRGRVEELARMLTGAEITDSARKHAKELLRKQHGKVQMNPV